MNIVITLPSSVKWEDYQKELDATTDYSHILNFKVSRRPVNAKVGDRCYLLWRGKIRGYQKISGFENKSFTCEVTGKEWSGNFIQRSGPFVKVDPISMKGFQGFRYFDNGE